MEWSIHDSWWKCFYGAFIVSRITKKNAPKGKPKSVGACKSQKLLKNGLFKFQAGLQLVSFWQIHFLFGSESSLISLAVIISSGGNKNAICTILWKDKFTADIICSRKCSRQITDRKRIITECQIQLYRHVLSYLAGHVLWIGSVVSTSPGANVNLLSSGEAGICLDLRGTFGIWNSSFMPPGHYFSSVKIAIFPKNII